MQNYEATKAKLGYIFNEVIKNGLASEKIKNYNITYKKLDYLSIKNKYDILTDYDFNKYYDNIFIINLETFPIEFLPFLKVIPIYKIHKVYEDFLTYNEVYEMDLQGILPGEYYYLTQKCLWDIKTIEENDITKYYLVGYMIGSLMNQDFDEFPLKGDVYIHIDYTGERK